MSNKKIPTKFKRAIKSFSIKPSVLLEFEENCFNLGVSRSRQLESVLITFNESVKEVENEIKEDNS